MITVDLKSGFYHVPVPAEFQKYLGIYYQGVYYVWTALPFGLKCSPFYFNKVLRCVVRYLREQGLRLVMYVDDCLLMCNRSVATDHKDLWTHVLQELGWHINYEKSSLEFEQQKLYLGFVVNSCGPDGFPWIKATKEKL